ncbi:hypothetical protein GEMRC1_008525 [Eukaryota sp. GEM-RC1]
MPTPTLQCLVSITENDFASILASDFTSLKSCNVFCRNLISHYASYLHERAITNRSGSICLNILLHVIYSGYICQRDIALYVHDLLPQLENDREAGHCIMDLLLQGPLLLPSLFTHCVALPPPLYINDTVLLTVPEPPNLLPLSSCPDPGKKSKPKK